MSLEQVKANRCFGGVQGIYAHDSREIGVRMRLAVYEPPQAKQGKCPILYYLSGLTCTEENVTFKAGAQRYAAEHGLIFVAPDTSPRGLDLPGEDESYDFGTGAGFYVDATVAPWSQNYRMYSYVTTELPGLIGEHFAADVGRSGITGHSMGGLGALLCALRNPRQYRSVSALAPICAPMQCPWGQKAFGGYLGADRTSWAAYDSVELVKERGWPRPVLVDQGLADEFLDEQLKPELLEAACSVKGVDLNLRRQTGYDHSYYFIASFIGDHIAFHAQQLK